MSSTPNTACSGRVPLVRLKIRYQRPVLSSLRHTPLTQTAMLTTQAINRLASVQAVSPPFWCGVAGVLVGVGLRELFPWPLPMCLGGVGVITGAALGAAVSVEIAERLRPV